MVSPSSDRFLVFSFTASWMKCIYAKMNKTESLKLNISEVCQRPGSRDVRDQVYNSVCLQGLETQALARSTVKLTSPPGDWILNFYFIKTKLKPSELTNPCKMFSLSEQVHFTFGKC